jgi:hypothetical protein
MFFFEKKNQKTFASNEGYPQMLAIGQGLLSGEMA